MKISNSFRKYLLVFFLLGQNSWNILTGRCGRFRIIRMIPAIIYLAVSTVITYPTIEHFRKLSLSNARTGGNIMCFVYSLSFFLPIISVINAIFYNREMSQLIRILDRTVKYLQYSSGKSLFAELCKFKRAYLKKCAIIFTACTFQLITKCMTDPLKFARPMHINVFTCLIHFYQNLSKAHILFYIDLLLWCHELNSDQIALNDSYILNADPSDRSVQNELKPIINVDEFIKKMRHCKYVHLKLFKISKLINSHFGWLMIILLLNSFVDCLMAIFWLFLHLREANVRNLSRKFEIWTKFQSKNIISTNTHFTPMQVPSAII